MPRYTVKTSEKDIISIQRIWYIIIWFLIQTVQMIWILDFFRPKAKDQPTFTLTPVPISKIFLYV